MAPRIPKLGDCPGRGGEMVAKFHCSPFISKHIGHSQVYKTLPDALNPEHKRNDTESSSVHPRPHPRWPPGPVRAAAEKWLQNFTVHLSKKEEVSI